MEKITITNVQDVGNDVLLVQGTVGETPEGEAPRVYSARGWVSATTNHFDAEDYQEGGHRKEDAQPREMTEAEKQAYCRRLLLEQNRLV